jgi:hypothetical protein
VRNSPKKKPHPSDVRPLGRLGREHVLDKAGQPRTVFRQVRYAIVAIENLQLGLPVECGLEECDPVEKATQRLQKSTLLSHTCEERGVLKGPLHHSFARHSCIMDGSASHTMIRQPFMQWSLDTSGRLSQTIEEVQLKTFHLSTVYDHGHLSGRLVSPRYPPFQKSTRVGRGPTSA